MIRIRLHEVSKVFPAAGGRQITALDQVSLDIQPGELFFILGPSGCGKSTALRILAGLETPDQGEVWFDEQKVNDLPAYERGAGMVFQHYALWPHMSVFENVAYGLRVRRLPREEIERRVREVLALVKMQDYSAARPAQLSGGQQQRIALARALVIRPGLLLLDEPLSNLDARLRAEMRDEIRSLHQAAGATTIYVTHDQHEALGMAWRMAVMNQGKIIQAGTPTELYHAPRSRFVAEFLGQANFIPARVKGREETGQLVLETALGQVRVPHAASPAADDERVLLMVRPEDISTRQGAFEQAVAARVRLLRTSFQGDRVEAWFAAAGNLTLRASLRVEELSGSGPGSELEIFINLAHAAALGEGEEKIGEE